MKEESAVQISISTTEAAEDFDAFLSRNCDHVNRALGAVLVDYLDGVDAWLADPIRYACQGEGKRFRPILFLACYEVSGRVAGAGVVRLATALEIVHAYSLVHDDLPCMDDDEWRRGVPTTHKAFGVDRATIAAAAMVPLAGRILATEARALGFDPTDCAALVAELSAAAGPAGMVGGQFLDLISEGRRVTAAELADIHRRKTGALIREAARLGGLVGRVEPQQLDALTIYGDKIGVAFQIADDLLDETLARDAEGRDSRSDSELEKATYPGVHGSARARGMARALSEEAIKALRSAGIRSQRLETLAVHVIEREK